MRVFIATFAFRPDSCKNVAISLEVGKSYRIISSAKRVTPGIWILALSPAGTKYDVYLSNQEMELGIIQRVKKERQQ